MTGVNNEHSLWGVLGSTKSVSRHVKIKGNRGILSWLGEGPGGSPGKGGGGHVEAKERRHLEMSSEASGNEEGRRGRNREKGVEKWRSRSGKSKVVGEFENVEVGFVKLK